MQTRTLGDSDLAISPIGFGAWALGGQWGSVADDESVAAIHRALERGVNWIDTAPGYGRGRSEEIVGRALRGLVDRPFVFTKCGFVWDDGPELRLCLKAESIRHEVEASLRRLEVEAIDLYQIHWREPDEDIEEAWATLADLRREGKVRWIGVSNFDVGQLERCRRIAPITSLQPPYSMLVRTPLWTSPFEGGAPASAVEGEILPFCERQGIGVVVYSPMASGLLSGRMTASRLEALSDDDWRRADPDFQSPAVDGTLALVERLRPIAERHGASVGELAVAWALRHPAVTGAIVGFRRPAQVDELVGAPRIALGEDDLREIAAVLADA